MKMNKLFALLALIICMVACKTSDIPAVNYPPNAFVIIPTLKGDGKTIMLNWTKAKDPNGDAVSYTIIMKDTLTKNISDTTYTITGLDFNFSQTGKVIAKDAKGLTTEASFTATTKAITFINIPDTNFEKYLVNNNIDKDGVNGKMNVDDAKGVRQLIIPTSRSPISNLTGIEAFIDLEKLVFTAVFADIHMDYGNITTLDVSKNRNLKYLDCSYNQLWSIDISKNVALDTLIYLGESVKLKSLDISKNINLTYLNCKNNLLTSLDVSNNVKLKDLNCSDNQITNLDVSKNINLQKLSCIGNQMSNLDVSKNVNLQFLMCIFSRLTSIGVSKNVNLQYLYCDGQMSNLDVSKNTALTTLYCSNMQLNSLDVSKNVNLTNLYCGSNNLSSLDITNNVNLKSLECYNNLQLTKLDISKNLKLQTLKCFNNKISTICVNDISIANLNSVTRDPYGRIYWEKDPSTTYVICN